MCNMAFANQVFSSRQIQPGLKQATVMLRPLPVLWQCYHISRCITTAFDSATGACITSTTASD